MVFVDCPEQYRESLGKHLYDRNILISNLDRGRLVCHLGISKEDILAVIDAFKDYFKNI